MRVPLPPTRARRQARLQQVEATFEPLAFDGAAARSYGQMATAVAEYGRSHRRRIADLLIAATLVLEPRAPGPVAPATCGSVTRRGRSDSNDFDSRSRVVVPISSDDRYLLHRGSGRHKGVEDRHFLTWPGTGAALRRRSQRHRLDWQRMNRLTLR
jgi:hypothetical protein